MTRDNTFDVVLNDSSFVYRLNQFQEAVKLEGSVILEPKTQHVLIFYRLREGQIF